MSLAFGQMDNDLAWNRDRDYFTISEPVGGVSRPCRRRLDGHCAKVSPKHYAQTTAEHFERAMGGAKSGAVENSKSVVRNRGKSQGVELTNRL